MDHRPPARPTDPRRPTAGDDTPPPCAPDEEAHARALEATGRFRVLRRHVPRPVRPGNAGASSRRGVIVDVETTGLDPSRDEVVEVGLLAFGYTDEGAVGDVTAAFSALRQPSGPIPAEVTRLTGIDDAMVAGRSIAPGDVEALVGGADLVIAHNAAFDRPFCERAWPCFSHVAWACSMIDVRWADRGVGGTGLAALAAAAGLFHDAHRALDDCSILRDVLALPGPGGEPLPFRELLAAVATPRTRIWATHSPFARKDELRRRGYRWSSGQDGSPKAWWIEVPEDRREPELAYLRDEIYGHPDADPIVRDVSALERFRAP